MIDISHAHPFKSATLVTLEHQQLVVDYGAGGDLVADYLQYKYSTPKPLGFLLWYVDVFKHSRAQTKLTSGSYPDPHKFP